MPDEVIVTESEQVQEIQTEENEAGNDDIVPTSPLQPKDPKK